MPCKHVKYACLSVLWVFLLHMRYAFLNKSDFICVKEYCCVSSAASDSDLRDLLCVCVWEASEWQMVWFYVLFFHQPFVLSIWLIFSLKNRPAVQPPLSTHTHARARARAHFLRNSCIRWLFFSFFFLWTCWIKSHSAWLLLHRNPLCDIMYSVNICALSVTGSTQISQRNKILFYINSTA